jgi:hypothetical protein
LLPEEVAMRVVSEEKTLGIEEFQDKDKKELLKLLKRML